MNPKLSPSARRYQAALCAHLKGGPQASLGSSRGLGDDALAAGLPTLDLARLHERTLLTRVLPGRLAGQRAALIKQAGLFFAAAIVPEGQTGRLARKAALRLKKSIEALSRRTVELAAANLNLAAEVSHRKLSEASLKKSERQYAQSLKQSENLTEQLRLLSRQLLSVQEDERRKISRELHDVIAQTLTGISTRLAALKKEAALSTKGLDRTIAGTQRLVEKSVTSVLMFARELRPAVLDDLGLVSALRSFLKSFCARTGMLARLTAFARVERLDTDRRTVLFRVAQEALTNVARHAMATTVEISIRKVKRGIEMKIADDGRSFPVPHGLRSARAKCLGLLGMRERVEMVGGRFSIDSSPGKGTVIGVWLPIPVTSKRRKPGGG